VRSKSWTGRGDDFQIGSQKEAERDAADLILYLKTSSSQDAGCCSRISQSGRLVENDARNTVFSYDAVTCGLDRGRVDLTRRVLPDRDATTSSRTIVGRDGGLEPKTNVRTDFHLQKAQPLLFEAHQNKRPTSPSPSPKQPSLSQGHIADPSNLHEKGCTPSR